jgi:hypothetical protein
MMQGVAEQSRGWGMEVVGLAMPEGVAEEGWDGYVMGIC